MTTAPLLRFEGVRRCFGSTVALSSLDLSLPQGTVLGLIGRNGAGKTTALRLALGELWPDAGRVETLGREPRRAGPALREEVSLLSEESLLYPYMTVAELMRLGRGLHPRWDDALAKSLLERLGLDPGSRLRTLSRGNLAKASLLFAVAPRPRLLLLDDPTAGLDPLVRREVLGGILGAVPEEGGAVVYASHLISDIERVADRVMVLDEGQVVLEGAIDELKARVRQVRAVFPGEAPTTGRSPGVLHAERDGRTLLQVVEGDVEGACRQLSEAGAESVSTGDLGLEDLLVALLAEPARPGEENQR